jgi:hypothetical protein
MVMAALKCAEQCGVLSIQTRMDLRDRQLDQMEAILRTVWKDTQEHGITNPTSDEAVAVAQEISSLVGLFDGYRMASELGQRYVLRDMLAAAQESGFMVASEPPQPSMIEGPSSPRGGVQAPPRMGQAINEQQIRNDEREKIFKELVFGDTLEVRWIADGREATWTDLKDHFAEAGEREPDTAQAIPTAMTDKVPQTAPRALGELPPPPPAPLVSGEMSAQERKVWEEIIEGTGYRQEVIQDIEALGGYQAILKDSEKQRQFSDLLDSLIPSRIVNLRNAMRELGWYTRPDLYLGKIRLVTVGRSVEGESWNCASYSINLWRNGEKEPLTQFVDPFQMTAMDLAQHINAIARQYRTADDVRQDLKALYAREAAGGDVETDLKLALKEELKSLES